MTARPLTLLAVGELIIRKGLLPDPEAYFSFVAPVLRSGDIVIGNGEAPYTARPARTGMMRLTQEPDNMRGLTFAGFNVINLANNHVWDSGLPGIEDTVNWLQEHGVAVVGAGRNIGEAKRPLIMEREGTRFGFLSYNCAGPKTSWATSDKPGCAYVQIITHYEPDDVTPGGIPTIYTWVEPVSLEAMMADIRSLRSRCDVLVVSFHKGLVHIPIKLAGYEQAVTHAAIDAGADLILGHHAQILKGVEFYKGKAIFHDLCSLVNISPPLVQKTNLDPQNWEERRVIKRELYNFRPDPEYPTYPKHPEAKQTIIAKCVIRDGRISRISYLPCLMNKMGQPELLKNDARGQEVFQYMEKITQGAGLNARFYWEDDEVVIHDQEK